MQTDFEFHPQTIALLPILAVCSARCTDPECGAEHYVLQVGWLCWTLSIYF